MNAPATLTAGARFAADVSALLRARNPLLWIVTREEARAERVIFDAAAAAGYDVRCWDCATGVSQFDGRAVDAGATDPGQALAMVRDAGARADGRAVWILRDLPAWLRDPTINRAVRSLARSLPMQPRDSARAMIVITPSSEVPPELAGHAIVLDLPMPDRVEVAALLDAAIAALPEEMRESAAPNGTRDAAIDAAIGLSADEAQSTFARSLIVHRRIDPATVAQEKRRVIARERVLEWFDPLPGGLDAVGGLELLKGWLTARRAAFSPAARAYGLPAPKGVLLVGVPGCGKSLTAKAIATAWGMPLLRLDLGALKSKFVGESESTICSTMHILSIEPATGRARRVLVSDVPPADLERAGALLAAALGHDRPSARVAPADPDRLELGNATSTARGMRATLRQDGVPLAHVVIALHSRAGASLWRALLAEHGAMIRGNAARPPAAPWCALVPELGASPPGAAGADPPELARRMAAALAFAFADQARPLPPYPATVKIPMGAATVEIRGPGHRGNIGDDALNEQFQLLPSPTGDELRELRTAHNWSASEAARAFWLADGRRWREVECGASRMSGERWTLGLLALGEHPTARLVKRPRPRGNTDPATVEKREETS